MSSMTKKRYLEIEFGDLKISEAERNAGWHFCEEWDYMLIGPPMLEWDYCTCKHVRLRMRKNLAINTYKKYIRIVK